jgi:protein transport protein SEC24
MEDIERGYLNLTTLSPASSKHLQAESKFPFGCILRPLAPYEENIPLVSIPVPELVRCSQCKGYVNLYSEFIDSGSKWVCNLCRTINEVPSEYFSKLGPNGKRIDLLKRPELTHASIDIIAPESYMTRPPMPCIYLFLIDLSIKAQENDYISLVVSTIIELLQAKSFPGFPRTEIGILFFDKSVHFVSFDTDFPIIYSESDLKDLFLPRPIENLLVNVEEVEEKLIKVLEICKEMVTVPYSTCYHAALRAAGLILQKQGGKIISFCGESLADTSHQLEFTFKLTTSYFSDIGKDFALYNICCTQFIRSSQYCNLLVLNEVSKATGGQVYFYPHFNPKLSGEKLKNEIIIAVSGLSAWESTLKMRVSSEWNIIERYGCFTAKPDGLLLIPVYNYPHSIVYELEPYSTSYENMYIQSAMLYTSENGERKLRIHNLKVKTADSLKDIYENANCDALVNLLSKKALQTMIKADKPESGVNYLETKCKEILKNCIQIWGKQPKSLELFCASILGLTKHYAFMNKSFGCNL